MSTPFTPITDDMDVQNPAPWTEIYSAVLERNQAYGGPSGAVDGALIASMTARLASGFASGADCHPIALLTDVQKWLYGTTGWVGAWSYYLAQAVGGYTLAQWLAAAGMAPSGFRRVGGAHTWPADWTNFLSYAQNSYGLGQVGDIVGPWCLDDLQKAISALRWTCISTGPVMGETDSKLKTKLRAYYEYQADAKAAVLADWPGWTPGPFEDDSGVYAAVGSLGHMIGWSGPWGGGAWRKTCIPDIYSIPTFRPCARSAYLIPIVGSCIPEAGQPEFPAWPSEFQDVDALGMVENDAWLIEDFAESTSAYEVCSDWIGVHDSETCPLDIISDSRFGGVGRHIGVFCSHVYWVLKWNFTYSNP